MGEGRERVSSLRCIRIFWVTSKMQTPGSPDETDLVGLRGRGSGICAPHSEKPSFKEMGEGGSYLWLRWNIALCSWNVPKGNLDSSLMTRSSVILHRQTYTVKQTGGECRKGVRSWLTLTGLSRCPRDNGGCYLRNVLGQGPC